MGQADLVGAPRAAMRLTALSRRPGIGGLLSAVEEKVGVLISAGSTEADGFVVVSFHDHEVWFGSAPVEVGVTDGAIIWTVFGP